MWLGPSVTHIKRTGRSAAFRGPGSEGNKKGKRDPRKSGEFLLNFSQPELSSL